MAAKTAMATITDMTSQNGTVLLTIQSDSNYWPFRHEFNVQLLSEFDKVQCIQKWTKSKQLRDLVGKSIRVIDDTCEPRHSLIAIGSPNKNRFISINGPEFPVSERRIYKRHKLAN